MALSWIVGTSTADAAVVTSVEVVVIVVASVAAVVVMGVIEGAIAAVPI